MEVTKTLSLTELSPGSPEHASRLDLPVACKGLNKHSQLLTTQGHVPTMSPVSAREDSRLPKGLTISSCHLKMGPLSQPVGGLELSESRWVHMDQAPLPTLKKCIKFIG